MKMLQLWKYSLLICGFFFQCCLSIPGPDPISMLESCVEPEEDIPFSREEYTETLSSQSKSVHPIWNYPLTSGIDNIPKKYIDIKFRHFSGHFRCQDEHLNGRHRLGRRKRINQLSICPWVYVKNIDTNRRPEVLLEAKCACDYASTPTIKDEFFCKNVFQYVTVLRRSGCVKGIYTYQRVWERVSVARVALAVPESPDVVFEEIPHAMSDE